MNPFKWMNDIWIELNSYKNQIIVIEIKAERKYKKNGKDDSERNKTGFMSIL